MVQVLVHQRVEVVLPEGVKEITLGYAQIEEAGCPFFTRTSKIVKKVASKDKDAVNAVCSVVKEAVARSHVSANVRLQLQI